MYNRSDVIYRYDGTFDGFLCCVFAAVYAGILPADILDGDTLLPARTIETEPDKAARVAAGIEKKIAPAAHDLVRTAFCADVPGKELPLLRFLLTGFSRGAAALTMYADEDVAYVHRLAKAVGNEAHRMKEFLRFSDHDGALTAVIAPRHDVLERIIPHFAARLPRERFLIYDERRKKAYVHYGDTVWVFYAESVDLPEPGAEERAFRRLWKLFYDTVEIASRHNDRCRDRHLPKYYRGHMTEFKD